MSARTLGTHNLHDGTGMATAFASVIIFTEATTSVDRVGTSHDLYVCTQQRDLVIALANTHGWDDCEEHYAKALFGARKVSPHRGTYWLTDDLDMVAFVAEHRINAWYPPYKRGEALFRRLAWWSHTRMTLRIIRRLKRRGYTVYAGGDLNTPANVRGYKGVLHEAGTGLDRVGSTDAISRTHVLGGLGSDHKRLRAVIA